MTSGYNTVIFGHNTTDTMCHFNMDHDYGRFLTSGARNVGTIFHHLMLAFTTALKVGLNQNKTLTVITSCFHSIQQ